MIRFVAAVILMASLSGCMVGERTSAPDSDGDKLPDEIEMGGWNVTIIRTVFVCFSDEEPQPDTEVRFVKSNELRQDTDGDGVSDLDEYFNAGDPTAKDTDGDGLDDKTEWDLRGTTTFFAGTRLALEKTDSDQDCLTDAQEIQGYDIPGIGHRSSDPTTGDSDHDGFSDAWEFQRSFTDPYDADTDDDGAADRLDLDPLNDVWMRIKFTSLTAKDLPFSSSRVGIIWNVPANVSSEAYGRGAAFTVEEGKAMTPPEDASPGEFDVGDERGHTYFEFDFYVAVLNDEDETVGFLDVNPHDPGSPVKVRYDVAKDEWQFGLADGGLTPAGKATSLETSKGRLTFLFEDFSPD